MSQAGGPRAAPARPSRGQLLLPLGLRAAGYELAIAEAEARGDGRALAEAWLAAGDALATIGRPERAVSVWEEAVGAALTGANRRVVPSIYWRLGQVTEGLGRLEAAVGWYERAADVFHREGEGADEAIARMALGRARFFLLGAGDARASAREAVAAAREAGDDGLLAESLGFSGEISLELGEVEEAVATLREAVRVNRRAARQEGEIAACVALAEALVAGGEMLQAIRTLEAVETRIEAAEDVETRGRGLGLLAVFQLEAGHLEEGTAALIKAREVLHAAGADLRHARLLVSCARRMEKLAGPRGALSAYAEAWLLAQHAREKFRLAPIAYALAACLFEVGEFVRADDVVGQALTLTNEACDLEGLAHCTELGVRIAVRLGAGKLALDRLLMLARARGRNGDHRGELRTLIGALSAASTVSEIDSGALAEEVVETLRRSGAEMLGSGEALLLADQLDGMRRVALARDVVALDGQFELNAGRPAEAARRFARAAQLALRVDDPEALADATALFDRALAIGEARGLSEVQQWRADRTLVLERGAARG